MVFIGTVGYNLTTKEPFVESIGMMAKDSLALLDKADKRSSFMVVGSIFCFSIAAWAGYYVYSVVKDYSTRLLLLKRQEALKAKAIENSLKQHGRLSEEQSKALECIICYSYLRDLIMLPCNHLVCCSECFLTMQNKDTCMICKKKITGTAHLFPE